MTEIRGQAELKKWSEILTSVSNILWQNSHLTHSDIFPLCTYCFWKINLHKIKQNLGFKDNYPTSHSCWKWHLAIKITFLRVKRSRDNIINFWRSKHKLNFTGILKYKNEFQNFDYLDLMIYNFKFMAGIENWKTSCFR